MRSANARSQTMHQPSQQLQNAISIRCERDQQSSSSNKSIAQEQFPQGMTDSLSFQEFTKKIKRSQMKGLSDSNQYSSALRVLSEPSTCKSSNIPAKRLPSSSSTTRAERSINYIPSGSSAAAAAVSATMKAREKGKKISGNSSKKMSKPCPNQQREWSNNVQNCRMGFEFVSPTAFVHEEKQNELLNTIELQSEVLAAERKYQAIYEKYTEVLASVQQNERDNQMRRLRMNTLLCELETEKTKNAQLTAELMKFKQNTDSLSNSTCTFLVNQDQFRETNYYEADSSSKFEESEKVSENSIELEAELKLFRERILKMESFERLTEQKLQQINEQKTQTEEFYRKQLQASRFEIDSLKVHLMNSLCPKCVSNTNSLISLPQSTLASPISSHTNQQAITVNQGIEITQEINSQINTNTNLKLSSILQTGDTVMTQDSILTSLSSPMIGQVSKEIDTNPFSSPNQRQNINLLNEQGKQKSISKDYRLETTPKYRNTSNSNTSDRILIPMYKAFNLNISQTPNSNTNSQFEMKSPNLNSKTKQSPLLFSGRSEDISKQKNLSLIIDKKSNAASKQTIELAKTAIFTQLQKTFRTPEKRILNQNNEINKSNIIETSKSELSPGQKNKSFFIKEKLQSNEQINQINNSQFIQE